jgi:hypothetical protein
MRQIKYVATGEVITVEDQVGLDAIISGIAIASFDASESPAVEVKAIEPEPVVEMQAPEVAAFIENDLEIK